MVGIGVKKEEVRNIKIKGSLKKKGNNYEVEMKGSGWLKIKRKKGEKIYKRDGELKKNEDGKIVKIEGNKVEKEIKIKKEDIEVKIKDKGKVLEKLKEKINKVDIGKLKIENLKNEEGIEKIGGNI